MNAFAVLIGPSWGIPVLDCKLTINDVSSTCTYAHMTRASNASNSIDDFNDALNTTPTARNLTDGVNSIVEQIKFENTNPDRVQSITITKSTLTQIPPSIFDHFIGLKSLDVSNCGVKTITPDTFLSATGLQRLQLSHNNITRFAAGALVGLQNLTQFEVANNQLRQLAHHTFPVDLANGLRLLDMSHNVIETIELDTFDRLVALETLVLDYNRLTYVLDSWFKKTKKLAYIGLTHNLINSIHDNAFGGLTALVQLRLSANQLSKIDVKNIEAENVDIDNNSIKSLIVNRQAKVLRLDAQSNLINKVRCDQSPPKLIGLILTNNSLADFGCITKMRRLEMLYLGFNRLRTITRTDLAQLINLMTLSLENNQIEFLEPGLFDHQLGIRTVILSNNRLKQFNFNIFLPSINVVDSIHLNGNNLTSITIENIKQTLPHLSVVDLSNNQWHCTYLADVLKAFERDQVKCVTTASLTINEVNVKGIRCFGGDSNGRGEDSIQTESNCIASTVTTTSSDEYKTSTIIPNSSELSYNDRAAQQDQFDDDDVELIELNEKIMKVEMEIVNNRLQHEMIVKKIDELARRIENLESHHRSKSEF